MNREDHEAKPGELSRAAKLETARSMLMLVLDQVDYKAGNCGVTEMVGAVLPVDVIDSARRALELTK